MWLTTVFALTAASDAATVLGTHRLYCMSCVVVPGFTTELDQFRVRQRLIHPHCTMEPIECLAHQDTCATVTMQVGMHHYWMGSGCDQRVNYDYPAGRDDCVEMPTLTRNFEPGYMEERRAVQRICLCSGNLCNAAMPRCKNVTTLCAVLALFWLNRFFRIAR